jgi:hypothetical protein
MRREFGVMDKSRLVQGYRQLLAAKMIREVYPKRSFYEFPDDYRIAKAVFTRRDEFDTKIKGGL